MTTQNTLSATPSPTGPTPALFFAAVVFALVALLPCIELGLAAYWAVGQLAEAGDAAAMERLGLWHLYGERLLGPGPWDRREAYHWLGRAADQGRSVARSLMQRAAAAPTASR